MSTLNDEFFAAREQGERHVERLQRDYRVAIREAARQAANRFSERATSLAASASWQPPDVGDVMAFAVNADRIRGTQREMMGAIGGRLTDIPGVSFDALSAPTQKQLDKLGLRAAAMSRDFRTPVANAIAEGWARGFSVPQTAGLIEKAIGGLAPGRAAMLARTDLISLSNGANHAVVGTLNEAAKEAGEDQPINSKTWLSSQDGRVRPTHQDADGQTVPIDQPYSVGGFDLQYPGDPDGPDEEVINCRCTELYSEEAATSATTSEVPAEAQTPETLAARFEPPLFENVPLAIQGELDRAMDVFTSMPLTQAMRTKLADRPDGRLPIFAQVKKDSDLDRESPDSDGFFRRSPRDENGVQYPEMIVVKEEASNPTATFLHEYGHFVDNAGFGAKVYMSIEPRTFPQADLMAALRNSKEMQALRARWQELKDELQRLSPEELATSQRRYQIRTMRYIEYLLRPQEMFARAFYQYAVSKHGGEIMQRSLKSRLAREAEPYGFTAHWSSADWSGIERLMDEVLREARLIPDEAVVAGLVREVVHVRLPSGVERFEPLARLVPAHLVTGEEVDNLLVGESVGASLRDVEHDPKHTARSVEEPGVAFLVMPYHKVKDHSECASGQWAVVKDSDGEVMGCHDTEQEANDQIAALNANEEASMSGTKWISDVAFEGVSTGDGRYMALGSLGWREPPLTLMAMIETPEFGGHSGAQVAGRMDTFTKDDEHYMTGDPLPEGVVAVRSTGEFDVEGERGGDTARMVENETMRGISMDLAVHEWALRDPETGDLIDPEEASDEDWERAFMGELEFAVLDGEIMAATVCPTPAFAEARIAILAAARVRPNVWRANSYAAFALGVDEGQMMTTLVASVEIVKDPNVYSLVDKAPFAEVRGIAAAGKPHATARKDAAPIAPPAAWLHRPEPREPTPFTILDSGECYGHLALWETCHTGYLNGEFAQCVRAPHSITSYGQFHVGELRCDEGDLLPIGKITYDTGHADLSRSRAAARCHYDDTGAVGAFVRARDGEFGIWVSGVLRNDIRPEGVRDLRANPLSGDWRDFERNLELIAALAVPVPGFPVARSQLALSASVEGDVRITALILTGLGLTAAVSPRNGNHEHEGAALDAIIAGGAAGLAELIG